MNTSILDETVDRVVGSSVIEDDRSTATDHQSNDSHQSSQSNLSKAILNVGGTRHEVMWRTLARFPHTRLGRLAQIHHSNESRYLYDDYNPSTDEYYFDRNPHTFLCILNYYRTGKLHLIDDLCVMSFDEDLIYWDIKEFTVELCCQSKYLDKKERLEEEMKKENELIKEQSNEQFEEYRSNFRRKLWDLFENPHTSKFARIITSISMIFIVLSSLTLVVSTIEGVGCQAIHNDNSRECRERFFVFLIESICITWFTIEYLIRFSSTPSKSKFFRSILNTIDLISILPFYISVLLDLIYGDKLKDFKSIRKATEILRVLRVMRILKLARHSSGLQLLGYSLKRSYKELSMLGMFLSIFILLFSSTVYFAEKEVNAEQFQSIPHAFWWAIITMTTVGYGDIYPKSIWGKLIGSLSAICGVLVIALPIPIIVSHFSDYYQEQLKREKLLKKRDRTQDRRSNQVPSDGHSIRNRVSFSIKQHDEDTEKALIS